MAAASPTNEPVIWIASYPKSGNTWVRFMACNLLFGRQESASSLAALIPDVHEGAAVDGRAPATLLKTHYAFSRTLPHAQQTAAALYVVRHPADVLVSNYFYSQRSQRLAEPSPADFHRYVDSFIEHRGDPRWIEHGMGSWEDNVRSWLGHGAEFPVLRLRYEDLIEDPAAGCRTIARLLRPESTEHEIASAVENSSFERMREIERADIRAQRVGIFYKPYLQASFDAGIRFMRRGVVGDGSARLSAAQRERLHSVFGALLEELGYS